MVRYYNYINLYEERVDLKGQDVVIWGISEAGISLYLKLIELGAHVVAFTDSFYKGSSESIGEIPIVEYRELKDLDVYIYISTKNPEYLRQILLITDEVCNGKVLAYGTVYGAGAYDSEKMRRLIESDSRTISRIRESFSDSKSIETFDLLLKYRIENDEKLLEEAYEMEHKQYFPGKRIIEFTDDEIFVDAGAYNGETSISFSKIVGGKYKQIYAMEPDPLMFKLMSDYVLIKNIRNITCFNVGAYSKSGTIQFSIDNLSGSSCISDKGDVSIKTISIDEMLNGKEATYIKMDIEGSELEALEGCKRTITEFKPKLAISVYHKDDDLWRIPNYIKENYPFYKLFLRHYTPITTETVLYATI